MAEPVNGVAYTFFISVIDSTDSTSFKAGATIAAGDFKVSKDGGTFVNLNTLPSVSPSGSIAILITLSATEMTGDKVVVRGIDASGAEWDDIMIFIDVPSALPLDILEGDHVESSQSILINKKDTTTTLVSKTITGSLLSDNVTIRTIES